MKHRLLSVAAVSLSAIIAQLPASASAASAFAGLPQFLSENALSSLGQCQVAISPAAGNLQSLPAPMDKASAILGGRLSRLEQIVRQQSGDKTGLAQTIPSIAHSGTAEPNLPGQASCQGLVLPSAMAPTIGLGSHSISNESEDFLASKRLRIQHTSFDAAWARVQHQSLPRGIVSGLSRLTAGRANLATLSAVNAWANSRIRYVEDKVLYGKADYWAGARTTLQRRAGDCEDIAIAKLQLLAALGVPKSDMYLTVARDLARNADHAVLVVRLDGRNWLLDNSTSQVLDASKSYDYRPIMSFSTTGKWLHGYSRM